MQEWNATRSDTTPTTTNSERRERERETDRHEWAKNTHTHTRVSARAKMPTAIEYVQASWLTPKNDPPANKASLRETISRALGGVPYPTNFSGGVAPVDTTHTTHK